MTTAHRTATTALLVVSLAAAGAPAASGQPGDAHHPRALYSRQDKSLVPLNDPPRAVVRVEAPASGFDWGDAGIGAAGGFALSMIGLGGALALSQRRTRRAPAPQP